MTQPPSIDVPPAKAFRSARLPPVLRPEAQLAILDVSEYVGERSGGVRTYLEAKGRYVAERSALRRTLIVPGERDQLSDSPGNRTYSLKGPSIPLHSYRLMLATRTVGRIIAHERPDIVEIGSSYLVPWAVSRARSHHAGKVVWFFHGNLPRLVAPGLATGSLAHRAVVKATGNYVRRVGRVADVTFAASDFAAAELAHWGVDQVERVALGVDVDEFTPARRIHSGRVRDELGVTGGPVVGFVGRLAAEKRLDVLLRAWPSIERRTGGSLVIVGDGPRESVLRAMAAGHRVHFVPFERTRARLARLIAAFDLFVSMAPFETFGLAICESLASGVPVVSVDSGGGAELVRRSGGGGVVPPDDPVILSDAVVETLHGDLDRMSRAARDFVVAHHSWDAALARMEATYRRLLR